MSTFRSSQVPSSARRPRHRASTTATEDGTQSSGPVNLPDFEPPVAPLNPDARRALAALLQSSPLTHLNNHINTAGNELTCNAGLINDRLTDARSRIERSNVGGNEEEKKGVEEFGKEVGEMTGRLEGKMRDVVDAEVKVAETKKVITEVGTEAEAEAERIAGVGSRRRGRGRRRQVDDDEEEEDEEEEDVEMEDAEQDDEKVRYIPSQKIQEKLAERKAQWEELSLTERYTENNNYTNFYRVTHEAKFLGDEIPPVPHKSTWFDPPTTSDPSSQTTQAAAGDGNSTTATLPNRSQTQHATIPPTLPASGTAAAAEDDDDDIAIAHERILPKCPLTLLPFRHPVTSTKCPHSFEREAITDMIQRSNDIRRSDGSQINPRGRRGAAGEERVHYVRCPVCEVHLSLGDLRDDPVLMRRVRRAEEIEAAEREEEDFGIGDGDGRKRSGRGRRSGVTVADDDDEIEDTMDTNMESYGTGSMKREKDEGEEERRRQMIKKEMSRDVSVVPNTQYATIED